MKKSISKLSLSVLASAFALNSAPAIAGDFAVTHATLAIGDGSEPVEDATVVVRGGKIVAAGKNITVPAGLEKIDGTGKWVSPGIFASATTLGLVEVDQVSQANDSSGGASNFNAALDVTDALNPSVLQIAVSRAGGVSRASVILGNGSAIFSGQGAIIDLGNDPHMVVKPRAIQYLALGESGAGISNGSRAANYAQLMAAFQDASDYAAGKRSPDDASTSKDNARALVAVLKGEQALYIGVSRADDIRRVLKIKAKFPAINVVLIGAYEGWMVAKEIAAAGIPVITNPLVDLPGSFEEMASTQNNMGRMMKAGVKVAIGTLNGNSGDQPKHMTHTAGNMVALQKIPGTNPLTWGQAFAAITSIPAEIAGFGGKMGILKEGAVGDVVIWDGDPLELSSSVVKVFIDGEEQNLTNHQTRLRDRYKDLDESKLPEGYDW